MWKLRSCGVEDCRKKCEEEMDYCKGAKMKFKRDEVEEVRRGAVLGLCSFVKEARTVSKRNLQSKFILLCLKAVDVGKEEGTNKGIS
jgi:hypothetical protein